MDRRARLGLVLYACGVYAAALVFFVVLSRYTAPAGAELSTLGGIEQSTELIKRVASRGLSQLFLPEQRARLAAGPLVLLGAWSKLSLGRIGIVDSLTAMRLPWLALGALAPLSLYLLLRPSRGRALASVGALLLCVLPRFAHSVVVLAEGALVASMFCVVLAAHVRALGPAHLREPGARCSSAWAVFGALALGVGSALSLGTLWVLAVIVPHFVWLKQSGRVRALRAGGVPLPALLLFALPLAPVTLLVLSPSLWRASPALVARVLLTPLAPSITPGNFGGKLIERPPVPGAFALAQLAQTLPFALMLAVLVGFCVIIHGHLARRFAAGTLRPRRDRHALGALAVIGCLFAVVGPLLTPEVLTTFPPRVELALPFIALLASFGLGWLAVRTGSVRRARVFHVVVLVCLSLGALGQTATVSASVNPLVGGTRRALAARALPLGDGSELGALVSAIDGLGRPTVTLTAPPDVSPELWRVLLEARRMRTRVTLEPQGELTLVRGRAESGRAIGEVRRNGAVLWSLMRTSG